MKKKKNEEMNRPNTVDIVDIVDMDEGFDEQRDGLSRRHSYRWNSEIRAMPIFCVGFPMTSSGLSRPDRNRVISNYNRKISFVVDWIVVDWMLVMPMRRGSHWENPPCRCSIWCFS